MTARDPSVEELRRESECSRAALTSTVVELRDKVTNTAEDLKTRLSPAHIKEEAKEYVRERSGQFFHSIERKARENPLQAVAIGAGLAYPLWGLAKSIPVPLMLVGAGLWLSRHKPAGGQNGFGLGDRVSEAGAQGMNQISESVRSAGDALAAGTGAVTDKVRRTAHDIRDSVTGMREAAAGAVQDVAGSVQDKVTAAAQSLSATASQLGTKAAELGTQSRNAFEDLVDRNPLLVAGVGLAIGAFIAASLPSSEAENRMFGESSDDIKDKALEAASQGVERAKGVAAGMVGDVAAAAAREGLDAEGLTRAVQGVTESVKSVVDKGLKTALGDTSPPLSPSTSSFEPSKI
jgi:ElaB/YqjD/DUF883 family membrane-anchored ribosome-binding protein